MVLQPMKEVDAMESMDEYLNAMRLLLEDIPDWHYAIGFNFAA